MSRSLSVRLVAMVAAIALAVPLMGAVTPRAYVSLGDSYTSGPLIPVQRNDPAGCLRSTNNYPSLVAPSLAITVHRDPSCSGATTADMANPQSLSFGGPNPPELDSLGADTTVVTLGIGGNDIGFINIAETCAQKSVSDPAGAPCKAFYTTGGVDQLAKAISATGPKVAAVITQIHRRSPKAKVFVIGYPDILPEQLTTTVWLHCYPVLPVAFGDVSWLRDSVEKGLNNMLRTRAIANKAVFVDTYTPSVGHDACQVPTVRWVEPVIPASGAAPVHPNADGMKATAAVVLHALRSNGVPTTS